MKECGMSKFLYILLFAPLYINPNIIYAMEEQQNSIESSEQQIPEHLKNLYHFIEEPQKKINSLHFKMKLKTNDLAVTNKQHTKKINDLNHELEGLKKEEAKIFNIEFIKNILSDLIDIDIDENGKLSEKNPLNTEVLQQLRKKLVTHFWEPSCQETKKAIENENPLLVKMFNQELTTYEEFAALCNICNQHIPQTINDSIKNDILPELRRQEEINLKIEQYTEEIAQLKTKIDEIKNQIKQKKKEERESKDQLCPRKTSLNGLIGLSLMLKSQTTEVIQEQENKIKELQKTIDEKNSDIKTYSAKEYKQDTEKQQQLIRLKKEVTELEKEKNKLKDILKKYITRAKGATWNDGPRYLLGSEYGNELTPYVKQLLQLKD